MKLRTRKITHKATPKEKTTEEKLKEAEEKLVKITR